MRFGFPKLPKTRDEWLDFYLKDLDPHTVHAEIDGKTYYDKAESIQENWESIKLQMGVVALGGASNIVMNPDPSNTWGNILLGAFNLKLVALPLLKSIKNALDMAMLKYIVPDEYDAEIDNIPKVLWKKNETVCADKEAALENLKETRNKKKNLQQNPVYKVFNEALSL